MVEYHRIWISSKYCRYQNKIKVREFAPLPLPHQTVSVADNGVDVSFFNLPLTKTSFGGPYFWLIPSSFSTNAFPNSLLCFGSMVIWFLHLLSHLFFVFSDFPLHLLDAWLTWCLCLRFLCVARLSYVCALMEVPIGCIMKCLCSCLMKMLCMSDTGSLLIIYFHGYIILWFSSRDHVFHISLALTLDLSK